MKLQDGEDYIIDFKNKVESIIRLIQDGEFEAAKKLFNESISGKYDEYRGPLPEDHEFFQLKMFLTELDDFINDSSVRATNATTIEELKRSFNETFTDFGR